MSNGDLYRVSKRYEAIDENNVWIEVSNLVSQYKAINLGQVFPDYMSNPYIVEKLRETAKDDDNLLYQYARSSGHLRLVKAIAQVYTKFLDREIDPKNEILITVGADDSLFNAIDALLDPGDEIILIEPFFDIYPACATAAKAKIVYVSLRPKNEHSTTTADWGWDDTQLEAAFNSKTRAILINTPNNPLGKVYTKEELEQVARLCIKWNCICISDEVYEHITYDRPHIRIATLPGMWERTLTIGSAGKSFSSTGAKLGWTIGCSKLVKLCELVHANTIYCLPTFIQEVIARCFELESTRLDSAECYFNSISNELKPKRDFLVKLLLNAGLKPIIPEGGYFIMVDISSKTADSSSNNEPKDSEFVKYLIKEKGLAAIPPSVFFQKSSKKFAEKYIRFCFFKSDSTLEKAAEILKNL